MQLFYILALPLLLMLVPVFIKNNRVIGIINAVGYFSLLLPALTLARNLASGGSGISFFNFFYVDSLSAFFILTTAVVGFASSLYSIDYIAKETAHGVISGKKAKIYYALFNLFLFSMFFALTVNNLGMLWAAIEMTTLASAFLVGFYNTGESVEAAWKYIIICSVGIAIALFGTILFYYALSGSGTNSLNWTDMAMAAKKLDPRVLKIAFLFILVGYGTKAGVAPMHTWLPDAHSQALTPISALLSAVLLKTALYAILRFAIIVNKCAGEQYCGNLFIFFGLLSLGISAGFVILQKDIKRLLAYSSIEHIGVVLVGFGISGVLGIYGALMHVFNHAAAKSLMFFCAGNILKNYKTTNMNVIRGLGKVLPFTGVVAILGAFALSGSPPFSLFISEIMILAAAFSKGSYIVCALFIIFLSVAFAAIVYNLSRVVFGKKPEGMVVEGEALSTKLAFVFLFVLICVLGVKIPAFFNDILTAAGKVVSGA